MALVVCTKAALAVLVAALVDIWAAKTEDAAAVFTAAKAKEQLRANLERTELDCMPVAAPVIKPMKLLVEAATVAPTETTTVETDRKTQGLVAAVTTGADLEVLVEAELSSSVTTDEEVLAK